MRKLDQFDMRAYGLFNKVRNGDPDDEVEDAIGDALRSAYEAGLRRAQELAKELSYVWYRNYDAQKYVVVQLNSLNQSIDAEAAKER